MNRFLIVLVFVTLMISRSFASNITVVTENLPPLQIAHKNQLVGGFATEVVELLLEQVGENARIIVTNWARAYHMARKHPNVLMEFGGLAPKYVGAEGSGWEMMYRFMNSVLSEQILYGTDWPVMSHQRTLKEWRSLNLKPAVLDALLGRNANIVFDRRSNA